MIDAAGVNNNGFGPIPSPSVHQAPSHFEDPFDRLYYLGNATESERTYATERRETVEQLAEQQPADDGSEWFNNLENLEDVLN